VDLQPAYIVRASVNVILVTCTPTEHVTAKVVQLRLQHF